MISRTHAIYIFYEAGEKAGIGVRAIGRVEGRLEDLEVVGYTNIEAEQGASTKYGKKKYLSIPSFSQASFLSRIPDFFHTYCKLRHLTSHLFIQSLSFNNLLPLTSPRPDISSFVKSPSLYFLLLYLMQCFIYVVPYLLLISPF